MKVRDLLIKIANGEDLPQKIKINKTIYELNNIKSLDELYVEKGTHWYYYNFSLIEFYNDEVEILEEEKKIPEKIEEPRFNKGRYYIKDINGDYSEISGIERTFRLKINEIIDCLDYLKSKGK